MVMPVLQWMTANELAIATQANFLQHPCCIDILVRKQLMKYFMLQFTKASHAVSWLQNKYLGPEPDSNIKNLISSANHVCFLTRY